MLTSSDTNYQPAAGPPKVLRENDIEYGFIINTDDSHHRYDVLLLINGERFLGSLQDVMPTKSRSRIHRYHEY